MKFLELLDQIKWIPSISITFIDVLQVIIIALVLYYLIRSVYKTRAWILVKGLFVIGAVYILICLTEMTVLQYIMQGLFSTLLIAIIIMLQPELQKIVEIIGQKRLTNLKSLINKKPDAPLWLTNKNIDEIVSACQSMSKVKTGALIVLEKGIPLDDCVQSGIELKSSISRQLLINIFEKNTPLHDGAIIIKNNRIESATCYLPLSTNTSIDKGFGTRHRAALGISETTDCVVIVVSEETGAVSLCVNGAIKHNLTADELKSHLQVLMIKDGEKNTNDKKKTRKSPLWLKILAPVVALFVWLAVMSANDPIIIKTIDDVQVKTENTQLLDSAGQTYLIKEGDTIDVRIKGRRSLLDQITASDMIAVADFSNMSIVYAIPIHITPIEKYADVEITSTHTMKLDVENLVQTEIPIEVQIIGDTSNDRVVSVAELETPTLLVTCSQSTAETLDKAVLSVDAYGKEDRFVAAIEPVVYDKNGEIISATKLSLNKVKVIMDVYSVREIPIAIKINTEDPQQLPEFYYELNEWSCDSHTIRLAGPDDIMNELTSLQIAVSTNQETAEAGTILINLKQYIPEFCHIAKNQKEQLTVSLSVTKFTKLILPLTQDNVNVSLMNALPADHEIKLLTNNEQIVLYYNDKIINKDSINIETLDPTLKITETAAGTYKKAISLTEIDGVIVVKSPTIQFAIAKKG